MRALIAVVLGLALLWGGYWFVGARAVERGVDGWFAAQSARGLIAERDGLTVAGFPNRFDVTIDGIHLADPGAGLRWQAPFVQVFSLSYKPWHLIAAWPDTQWIGLPGQDITLGSTRLMGSLVLVPGLDLALDRVAVTGDALSVTSSLGWGIAADSARFATRQDPSAANAHEVGVEVTGLAPDAALLAVLAGVGLPGKVEVMRLSAVADLSAPLDRHMADAAPEVLRLRISEAVIRWGELGLFAKGEVAPDAQGFAAGRIEVRIENWRVALAAANALGLVPPALQQTAETVLAGLASQSGDADVLTLPLVLQGGRMSFGPIPLGPAPRMR